MNLIANLRIRLMMWRMFPPRWLISRATMNRLANVQGVQRRRVPMWRFSRWETNSELGTRTALLVADRMRGYGTVESLRRLRDEYVRGGITRQEFSDMIPVCYTVDQILTAPETEWQ